MLFDSVKPMQAVLAYSFLIGFFVIFFMPLIRRILTHQFLSRLFGGEPLLSVSLIVSIFLSRLFGGELPENFLIADVQFLSRLFGGELP